MKSRLITLLSLLLAPCAFGFEKIEEDLSRHVPDLIKKYNVAGVGVAIVDQHGLQLERYFGLQAPGKTLTASSVFNVASVAKTITAETAISLLTDNTLSLDDAIYPYFEHPDLVDTLHYNELKLRHLLSHSSGLLNWPYNYDDSKLAFTYQPGTSYSYSGAGIEIAAKYMAKKTQTPYKELAQSNVFKPAGLEDVAIGHIPDWATDRLNQPMDGEGRFRTVKELNSKLAVGDADAAADDLITTLPAYATLLSKILKEKESAKSSYRSEILTRLDEDNTYRCEASPEFTCPEAIGHSVGWQVWKYEDHSVITHSGTDAGETALVYFSPEQEEGAIIFINGSNGWPVLIGIMEILRQQPQMTAHFRQIINRVMGTKLQSVLHEKP